MFSRKPRSATAVSCLVFSLWLLLTATTVIADEPRLGTSEPSGRSHPGAETPPPSGSPPLLGTSPDDSDKREHRDDADRHHDKRRPPHHRVRPYPYYYPYGYRYAPPLVSPAEEDEEPAPPAGPPPGEDETEPPAYVPPDAWDALAHYRLSEALFAFETEIVNAPDSALPRVGYALTVALSGELSAGAREMRQALDYDLYDLHFFHADEPLVLIIEELLLDYPDDPLMTASLLYLKADFTAADTAADRALEACMDCSAARTLKRLIGLQIR
jgi:hypothetical protein